jgi:hypothetical protein
LWQASNGDQSAFDESFAVGDLRGSSARELPPSFSLTTVDIWVMLGMAIMSGQHILERFGMGNGRVVNLSLAKARDKKFKTHLQGA